MPADAIALVLLTMVAGGFTVASPAPAQQKRGPLTATISVSQPADARAEVVLEVVLRNTSDRPQSFSLERPAVEFFVKDRRGAVIHASPPCVQGAPCSAGLASTANLGPGEQMAFVERWRPRGGCLGPGTYAVKAKLRAYQAQLPGRAGAVGGYAPFILRTEFHVRQDGAPGECDAARTG
ncbi:MAG TPA: hypothetical protein VFM53_06625 [Anaeromyxobacteraceae bacterium]|jgi:hypothetical protein|nr:hypothetical protein [Anaeromyxobacteraceae bacterium]